MKTYLSLFLLVFCYYGHAEDFDTYSLEIPIELAQEIENHTYREFGQLESFTFTLLTENDNLGHGLGAALGLKALSEFEGDDLGKSFAIDLNLLWKYENAELAVSFFLRPLFKIWYEV